MLGGHRYLTVRLRAGSTLVAGARVYDDSTASLYAFAASLARLRAIANASSKGAASGFEGSMKGLSAAMS